MDSRARLLMVAVASLVAGFLISKIVSIDAQSVFGTPLAASLKSNNKFSDADPDNKMMPVELEAAEIPAAPIPVPVPAISPSLSYQLEPLLLELTDPVVEPLLDVLPEDPPLEWESEESPELDFVAMLHHDGAEVEDGFDGLAAGTLTRMTWQAGESLYGSSIPTPVLVAQGSEPGPTLCLTGAVHGDELNGIETVRRVMYSLNPEKLSGRIIGVPIVNLQGFERHSRYLPDRRDLNRFFPGNPKGSSASRIAYGFFEQIIRHCDSLVDLHTGSFHRTNLPQLRANLLDESVIELTERFGGLVILHSSGNVGTLRAAAVAAGIPAVTIEAGEPLRVDDKAVDHTVRSLFTLMDNLHMYDRRSLWGNPEPTYYGSLWVRADKGGMLIGEVKLGKRVRAGDVLGSVTDPITNARQDILAPITGRVIGMALNQFVMPGYAAFHLGVEARSLEDLPESPSEDEIDHSVAQTAGVADERDDSEE